MPFSSSPWPSHPPKMFCFRKTAKFSLYFHYDFTWCLLNAWFVKLLLGLRTKIFRCLSVAFENIYILKVFQDHIQSGFSSIYVFFYSKNRKLLCHVFLPELSNLFSMYWHHPWHNNRLWHLTSLLGKKSQRNVGEGMLGMLVQCSKDSFAVLTVEALCVLSCSYMNIACRSTQNAARIKRF